MRDDVGLGSHVVADDLADGFRHLLDQADGLGKQLGDQRSVPLGSLQNGAPGQVGKHAGGGWDADDDDQGDQQEQPAAQRHGLGPT